MMNYILLFLLVSICVEETRGAGIHHADRAKKDLSSNEEPRKKDENDGGVQTKEQLDNGNRNDVGKPVDWGIIKEEMLEVTNKVDDVLDTLKDAMVGRKGRSWLKRANVAIYGRSDEWRLVNERKIFSSVEDAKAYGSTEGYNHFMYCGGDVSFGSKSGRIKKNTALFIKRRIVKPWFGTTSKCDWYTISSGEEEEEETGETGEEGEEEETGETGEEEEGEEAPGEDRGEEEDEETGETDEEGEEEETDEEGEEATGEDRGPDDDADADADDDDGHDDDAGHDDHDDDAGHDDHDDDAGHDDHDDDAGHDDHDDDAGHDDHDDDAGYDHHEEGLFK